MRYLLAAALVLASSTAFGRWENVADEWTPYKLTPDQKNWFGFLQPRAPGSSRCCDVGDGHPVDAVLRRDGWYVPHIDDPTTWVRVPDEAMDLNDRRNMVGVAVVFWYNTSAPRRIRCFVPPGLD